MRFAFLLAPLLVLSGLTAQAQTYLAQQCVLFGDAQNDSIVAGYGADWTGSFAAPSAGAALAELAPQQRCADAAAAGLPG